MNRYDIVGWQLWINFTFWEIHFFSKVFFLEKTVLDLVLSFFITESFSFDVSDKTTSWITSIWSMVCWEELKKTSYLPYFHSTIMSKCIFSAETYSSTTIWILLPHGGCINQFIVWYSFSFLLLQDFFTYQLDFSGFWVLSVTFHLVSDFLFLVLWMLWRLVTVNNGKHMICHGPHASWVRTYEIFLTQFFPMCPIKLLRYCLHTSWLATVKRVKKNFLLFFQKNSHEKEKKNNTDNCKAFLRYTQAQERVLKMIKLKI